MPIKEEYNFSQDPLLSRIWNKGNAADLLTNGRTAHRGFKLPIPLLETSTSSMRIPSPESEKIKKASPIIIDEASMPSGNALRKICVLKANRNSTVGLVAIGNGTISDGEEHGNDFIEIPQQMHSSGNIVQDIFGHSLIVDTNEEIKVLNNNVLDLSQGESTLYTSVDSIAYDNIESEAHYPVEFLNSQTPSGIPPHFVVAKFKIDRLMFPCPRHWRLICRRDITSQVYSKRTECNGDRANIDNTDH
ncbi:uncharacterized protein LOC143030424 [Oratosquilla oratoria]|uniref:uncharacterized protein LOC143030424 n=1 Tax=Oratosquilla oratoria TaxID=337810 RepID=UPI003F76EE2C